MTVEGRNERGKYEIDVTDIVYIEAFNNDVFICTNDNEYKINQKLYFFEEYSNLGFVRINKSYVVNIKKVKDIEVYVNYRLKLLLTNNYEVFVNRKYMKTFKNFLKNRGEL